jgi:AcrR family transcriptional regulator
MSTPPRTAPVSRDETRRRILAAALRLMAENGFAATSTREVCEQMGFTKAALYYHFRSKDDLLAELVAPLLTDLDGLLPAQETAITASGRRQLLAAYADLVMRHAELIRLLNEDPSVRRHPALATAPATYAELVRSLSGSQDPDLTGRVRARAALGAVRAALVRSEPDEDRDVLRSVALVTGCGALGIPGPRQS